MGKRKDWLIAVGVFLVAWCAGYMVGTGISSKLWHRKPPTHAYVDIDNDGPDQVYISGKNCGTDLVDGHSTVVKCEDLVVITRGLPRWWKVVVVPEDGK